MSTSRATSLTLIVQNPKKLFRLRDNHSNYNRIVDDNVFFISDRGKRTFAGDRNFDYNTDVWISNEMSWEISQHDPRNYPDYEVSLLEIKGEANSTFFTPNPAGPDSEGKITVVIDEHCVLDQEEKYSIKFGITGPDGTYKDIEVDPKLKIIT